MYPPSPNENGTETQRKSGSKSTLEENAYEDIVGKACYKAWQNRFMLSYHGQAGAC